MPKSNLPVVRVSEEDILEKIYVIRGQKVMIDRDLAEMYGVEVRVLNQAVKRNASRFPTDFMFQISKEENDSLRSQFVILKRGRHSKYLPYAFTEQGVAMLSSVLNSETAIQVNIQIIRLFTKMKELILDNKDLWMKIEKIEQNLVKHDVGIGRDLSAIIQKNYSFRKINYATYRLQNF